jgi:recombinational DNA repair protein (RecF pathway)
VIPSSAPAKPALDPLVLSFQLKLLWVSGYMPHLESCVECGAVEDLVGYLPAAGGAVCRNCGPGSIPLSPEGVRAIQTLVATPLAEAGEAGLTESRAREALAIVRASYEHQGGFRLRRSRREADARRRLRAGRRHRLEWIRDAVHRFISEESYWATGTSRETMDG